MRLPEREVRGVWEQVEVLPLLPRPADLHDAAADLGEVVQVVGRVEERIRSSMFLAGASFPGIRLSREAAFAAQKNLELVLDQYSRGVVDIIKLLNSQNAALTANESAANAVFDFLIDLISIQRGVGQFDYFLYEEDRVAWFERLSSYFSKSGITPSPETGMSPF